MSSFRFLELPGEIRDMIYTHLVTFDGVQQCIDAYNKVFPHHRAVLRNPHLIEEYKKTPSILLVNHQIYGEALPLISKAELYVTTPLLSAHLGGLGLSISSALLPPGMLRRIRHLRFGFKIWDYPFFGMQNVPTFMIADYERTSGFPGWSDEDSEHALLFSSAWVPLWIYAVDCWIEEPLNGRTLVMEQELGLAVYDIDDNVTGLKKELFLYNLPTATAELAKLKAAIYECWGIDQYEPLLRYLTQYLVRES